MINSITKTDLRGILKPAVKAKWLEALRSGDYEKGTGTLKTEGDAFCCLGVLADTKCVAGKWADGYFQPRRVGVAPQGDILDDSYIAAIVTDQDKVTEVSEFFDGLATRNDGGWSTRHGRNVKRQSHRRLAQLIERNL